MFWSIDRLGRSTAAVATTLAELETAGIIIYADKQAIDATTAYGKAMLHMAATFAELERDVIRDRVKAGIARVRQEIREGGEPEIKARLARGKKNIGRPPVAKETAAKAREYLGQGHGIIRVAKQLGIGVGTVQKIKRAAQAGAATLPAGSGYAAA
jgi:DNA invertase Pin-like site-specific DNA recombinase